MYSKLEPIRSQTLSKLKMIIKSVLILALLTLTSIWIWHPTPRMIGSGERVFEHLKNLEDLASEHGDSRSPANGHNASLNYIQEQISFYPEIWHSWTEEVIVKIQINNEDPILNVVGFEMEFGFESQTQIAVMKGSGSTNLKDVPLKFVEDCEPLLGGHNEAEWVALIDASRKSSCSPCDKMMGAIQKGAKGIIFVHKPGNQQGYPKPLQPSPGRCGRHAQYREAMGTVGAVSLSDDSALILLSLLAGNPDLHVDLQTDTLFTEFVSHNLLAETFAGDENQIVIFGSHLDSVQAGPGINDDGSGAMGTLDLVQALADSGLVEEGKIKNRVRLAWWTGEEIGLIGSTAYVHNLKQNHPEELEKIKMTIDTDMIASSNYIRGVYDGTKLKDLHLRRGSIAIQRVYENYFHSLGLPTAPGYFDGRSDYAAFMDELIPSGGLFTGAESIKTPEQAELFGGVIGVCQDPCYHQNCDRLQQIRGSGFHILKENMGALSHSLEYFATGDLNEVLQ